MQLRKLKRFSPMWNIWWRNILCEQAGMNSAPSLGILQWKAVFMVQISPTSSGRGTEERRRGPFFTRVLSPFCNSSATKQQCYEENGFYLPHVPHRAGAIQDCFIPWVLVLPQGLLELTLIRMDSVGDRERERGRGVLVVWGSWANSGSLARSLSLSLFALSASSPIERDAGKAKIKLSSRALRKRPVKVQRQRRRYCSAILLTLLICSRKTLTWRVNLILNYIHIVMICGCSCHLAGLACYMWSFELLSKLHWVGLWWSS